MLHVVIRLLIVCLSLWVCCAPIKALPLAQLNQSASSQDGLFIFVSFSMKEAALKALYRDAQSKNAILVLRGLQDNSFKKTAETLKGLGIRVQINPKLFEKYRIQSVPTFVSVQKNQVHTLSGHVSLDYVLACFKSDTAISPHFNNLTEKSE